MIGPAFTQLRQEKRNKGGAARQFAGPISTGVASKTMPTEVGAVGAGRGVLLIGRRGSVHTALVATSR